MPPGGALIAIENLIDGERRVNASGLLSSLNMLIEFGDAFEFTAADFRRWCEQIGFGRVETLPLTGTVSAAIACKHPEACSAHSVTTRIDVAERRYPIADRGGSEVGRAALPADTSRGRRNRRGATIWLTGLPSAGKTTVATALAARLRAEGREVEVLDDEARRRPTAELGFSKEHRDLDVARVGYVAELLARHGVLVLAAVIAPYADARDAVRKLHEESGTAYAEVHIAAPLHVCRSRDVRACTRGTPPGRSPD